MTMNSFPENPTNNSINHHHHESMSEDEQSFRRNSCWKLYENPFFISTSFSSSSWSRSSHQSPKQLQRRYSASAISKHMMIHGRGNGHGHGSDLNKLIRCSLSSSMDRQAQARIVELKAELDLERKVRRKMEALNKRLAREVAEERRVREQVERNYQELLKSKICRKEFEFAAERERDHLLRVNLADHAKMRQQHHQHTNTTTSSIQYSPKSSNSMLHHKDKSANDNSINNNNNNNGPPQPKNRIKISPSSSSSSISSSSSKSACISESKSKSKRSSMLVGGQNFGDAPTAAGKCNDKGDNNVPDSSHISLLCASHQRNMWEPENPHIKRGIKGLVEFPRLVKHKPRAMMPIYASSGSTHFLSNPSFSSNNSNTSTTASASAKSSLSSSSSYKMECQRAQLGFCSSTRLPHPSLPTLSSIS